MRYTSEKFVTEGKGNLLINIAVIITLAYVASLWANLFLLKSVSEVSRYMPPKAKQKAVSGVKADYSSIKSRNIFNAAERAAVSQTPAQAAIQSGKRFAPTTLGLKLIGTVIATGGMNSAAVIEDSQTGGQELYRMYDEVAPGASIIRIERFRVVIDNAGRMEEVSVDFEKTAVQKTGGVAKGKRARLASLSSSSAPVRMLGGGRVLMDRRYLDNRLKKMNDLLVNIRAVPKVNKEGAMEGFSVFEIKKGSIYDKIGLKNKDVIQRINGQPLDSAEKGLDLFLALKNETRFTVDLVRNNANKTLTIEVQ